MAGSGLSGSASMMPGLASSSSSSSNNKDTPSQHLFAHI
jgi:hypothetical protein